MTGALHDVRVVDLSDTLAGAFCGRLFSWLGADVVLVERPQQGSEVRWQPPFLDDVPGPERSGVFLYTGCGKKSLTLDIAHPDGRAVLGRLLARADLLIEDRNGPTPFSLDEEWVLQQSNPRLVRVSLRKFSPGPYEKYAASELQMTALGGWMIQIGEPGRTPLVTNSVTLSAFVPGIIGAIAGLAALLRARSAGEGAHLDLSAHEALLFVTL